MVNIHQQLEHILVGYYHLGTKPKWERWAIALTCAHMNNTYVVCCTSKTLDDVIFHLCLVHSFYALLFILFTIALINSSVSLYSIYYLLFFFHKVTFKPYCVWNFTSVSLVCVCHKKYSRHYNLTYQFFDVNFWQTCVTLFSMILRTYKNSNWFYFLYWSILAL